VRQTDPFFPVGVWYTGPAVRRDLQSIKALGFNSVWSGLDGFADLVAQARTVGLNVIGHLDRTGELHVGPSATPRDLRVWGWTAMLRGARAIGYHAWSDLVDERGAATARGKAAGEFAGVVSRNPALFAPLKPRTASAGNATPDVRISGVEGEVEAGFLESRDVLLLIAVNHASSPQDVALTFAPGTRQEFWQNMETGDMVSLTMVEDSPSLAHGFAARDALVLMIRTRSPYDRAGAPPSTEEQA
jgi:hypothetical protein